MHEVGLRPVARLRVVGEVRLPQVQRRFERAGDELLLPRIVVPPHRVGLGGDDARQLIEELPHVRRQRRRQLLERALDVVAKRRAGERFEQRAAEVERAQLRHGQAGRQALERLAVHAPPRLAIVVALVVVEREARLFERLQVAADRARRDAQSDASSSIVTPAPRARSISRRIVHWRMTSALRGTREQQILELQEEGLQDCRRWKVAR